MTRQELAKKALQSEGFMSAKDIPAHSLGDFPQRNRQIVQEAIFEGRSLVEVGKRAGLSRERVRTVSLKATRLTIGRYE